MRFHLWPLLLIAAVLALVAIAGASSATDFPGDWNIVDHQAWSSDTINVAGTVTVRSGGHLDLTNVDLNIGSTAGDGLVVEAGGRLTVNGGSIGPLTTSWIPIELHDRSTLEGVTITAASGSGGSFDPSSGANPPLTGLKGGVQVYDDDVYIGNCTITACQVAGVYVKDSTPTIYGNTIMNIFYWVDWYRHDAGNDRHYATAQAFGILLDNSPAMIESNDISKVGNFTDLITNWYGTAAVNDNYFAVIAAGVGARSTRLDLDSNDIADVGILDKTSNTENYGGNDYRQYLSRYTVAGAYAFGAVGSNIKLNTISNSGMGIHIVVSPSATGLAMDFDIIIDNEITGNKLGGVMFELTSVVRDCNINVSDNDIDRNGEAPISGLDDCGVLVYAASCSADITLHMQQNNVRNNLARGVFVSAIQQTGDLTINVVSSNTFSGNNGAGLLVDMDTVGGDVMVSIENSTFTSNNALTSGDGGAITLTGTSLTGDLDVKISDTTSSGNTGSGLYIAMGEGLGVNLATNTLYEFISSSFSTNTQYGIYLYDNYGANAQRSVYKWRTVHASNNNQAVYVHSNSQLGNIDFQVKGLTASDSNTLATAVTIQLTAATYTPKSHLDDLRITYTGGAAPSATGVALQGVDMNKRWTLEMNRPYITQPGTALDAQFCEITVNHGKLEGVGVNTIIARDSNVHLYYCDVPDLSAQAMGNSIHVGVYYYRWFNITKVSWQNGEPIRNQTITIKRFRDPQDEVYTAVTDGTGDLPNKQVPFWVRTPDAPLRNDELQAYATIRGDTLSSLWFDFNDTQIGIEDPDVPELVISSPFDGTVQKSGVMAIQGEIRDTHSGIRYVEVTLDNVVWYTIPVPKEKIGASKYTFNYKIENLTDGVYTISVRGWDVARYPRENLSYQLVTVKDVKIDTQPPAMQVLQPPTAYEVTNNVTYTLIGQTERSINIKKLTINGSLVPVIGTTFTLPVKLHEGSNFFVIIAEDRAGNIAVATREIILDITPPTLIVTSPSPGFSSNDISFEVAGDTEQTAKIYVQLDNKAPQLAKKSDSLTYRFYFVLDIKEEGTHTVTVIAEDVAGNTYEESMLVRYDITPPVLEDIVPKQDSKPTNQQTVQVSGHTDPDVSTVSINGLRFPVQDGFFAAEINLLEGPRTLLIHVTDMAGNENQTTRSILIDVTPPLFLDLTVSSTKAGGTVWDITDDLVINERSVRFRGRLAEADYRDLYIQVEADNRSGIMDDPDGLTFYRDFNLEEDDNIVSFFAIDIAGNRITQRFVIVVDPRPPTVEYFNPRLSSAMEAKVRDQTVFISGKVADKGAVTLFINNRQVVVTPTTGAFQTNVPLEEGLNNIPVEVTDRAGNKATDILRITYQEEAIEDSSIGDLLVSLWWVFAILIGLGVLLPLVSQTTRSKWMVEHPELEQWDPQKARDGLYEYEEEVVYMDQYDQYGRGGGY